MSLETGLIGFAGLTCLSLAMKKHRAKAPSPRLPAPPVARVLGWLLLGLSALAALMAYGPATGWVAWLGQLSVAGAILVLLMSWRPAVAPRAAVLATTIAIGLAAASLAA